MPDDDLIVTAEYQDIIIDPGTGDDDRGGDIVAGVVIGGIAVVGAYEVGTGLYRITQMDDAAMPANRTALAELLWERAGKPEPETMTDEHLYSDLSAEDDRRPEGRPLGRGAGAAEGRRPARRGN